MNGESGFSGNGTPYEYTVSQARNGALMLKKLCLIAVYVAWVAGILFVGAAIKIIVPLLALTPISLWILVFLTWRYTQIEYEYSFFAGQLTVCRIFGGRSRKVLLTLALRELEAVIPCREEYADRINRFTPDRTVFAASSETAESLYALLHRAEDGTLTLLYLDATEKAVKIMRYYNAAAVTRA